MHIKQPIEIEPFMQNGVVRVRNTSLTAVDSIEASRDCDVIVMLYNHMTSNNHMIVCYDETKTRGL